MNRQLYQWEGYVEQTILIKGHQYATHKLRLIRSLEKRGIRVQKIRHCYFPFHKLNTRRMEASLIQCFYTLGELIQSGIPTPQALTTVTKQLHKHPLLAGRLYFLGTALKQGHDLSWSMQQTDGFFDQFAQQLVIAGEQTGTLGHQLLRIAKTYEDKQRHREAIQKALLYPSIVLVVSLCVTLGLLLFVIPKFSVLYQDFGQQLPWLTRLLIQISNDCLQYCAPTLLGLIFFTLFFSLLVKYVPNLRYFVDRAILNAPIIGAQLRAGHALNLVARISDLASAHIPIHQAVELASLHIQNSALSKDMTMAHDKIIQGDGLHAALRIVPIFTDNTLALIQIGETSGTLCKMLARAAENMTRQEHAHHEKLERLIEPMLMLIVGSLVCLLTTALYLPIFQLGDVIQ